jgi:hypothetical protein
MGKFMNENRFEGLNAEQIWSELYNKELNSKKTILEYIEITGILKKQDANEKQLEDTYNFIYGKIDDLREVIKPNTAMYLKNRLKAQLGKYVAEKDPMPKNEFIEFLKQAYPENARRKDFTWALMDVNKISEEQAWNTLTYINRECLSNNLMLTNPQRKEIIKVIENTIKKNNIKYVNKIRSLKPLTDILNLSIVKVGNTFRVRDTRLK